MKICLDLHDWSVVNNRFDLLFKLKKYFPDLKVSLFTVPIDTRTDWGAYQNRGEFLKTLKENLDWIQLIPHGLTHNGSEMRDCDYKTFKTIMVTIKDAFDRDGLPFEKGFCAPHWRWSEGVVKALDEEGWWGSIDPRQNMLSPKKFYRYSQAIDKPIVDADLKLHGHIYGTANDLGLCFDNLLNIPPSAEWHFITDFLE